MACETLQAKVDELEERLMEMDAEYVEAENKQMELENDIQELWDVKEALEKEQEEVNFFAASSPCAETNFFRSCRSRFAPRMAKSRHCRRR
jgi:chromosome segregation ATPase